MKRKNKGGFSLVEVVIALAIIVMVMGVGLSITLSSITTKVKAINRIHAQYFADNVLECFKEAESKAEFQYLFSEIYSHEHEGEEGLKPSEYDRGDGRVYYIYTHKSANYQFIAEITVMYTVGTRPELRVNVSGEDGEDIISLDYTKGAIVAPAGEGGGNND